MGAFSFKGIFVDAVELGLKRKKGGKRQTIRNFRKRPLKVGERVVLYYAQRSPLRRRLGESVIKSRQIIEITEFQITIYNTIDGLDLLEIDKTLNTKQKLDRFARADGFQNFEVMKRWWLITHGTDALPYSGNLYKW